MSNYITLKLLFTALHGSLPYEYDEKYINGANTEDSIAISKTGSEHTIYITANLPYDNNIFNVTLYDDPHDNNPTETSQWDADDQNTTLLHLIAYIERNL